jgi:hypothetical protein
MAPRAARIAERMRAPLSGRLGTPLASPSKSIVTKRRVIGWLSRRSVISPSRVVQTS